MTERPCPTDVELSRGFPDPDDELAAHLATCAACTRWWDDTSAAIELARGLPIYVPSASHREEVRTALLARVARAPADVRRRWIVPLVAAAAAAVLVVHVWPAQPPRVEHAQRGTVHAHTGATYTLASSSPDEIVRLRDGTVDIDVQPLQAGERFRVIVGVDEVEVHGTSFEVVADHDHLRAVRVVHGRVEVRHLGDPPTWLGRGETWAPHVETAAVTPAPQAPIAPAPIVPAPVPQHHPAPHHVEATPAPVQEVAKPTPPPSAPDPQEAAFNAGWHAMQSSDYKTAATAFARAVALDPDGALAEDAAFWHAVALARLGHDGEAEIALRSFLGDFRKSTRAGEASAMLGWLLVAKGELEEARERFNAAVGDPSPSVQKSAREGLKALDAKH